MTMQGLPEGYRDEGTYLEPQDQDRAEFVVEGSRAPREALPIENPLSSPAARVPKVIARSSGIVLQGRRLHSFIYSTDVAIIRNTNADAVLAVYPFTGHPVITQAILAVAQAPVFVGVGGGTTTGSRVIELAVFAEMQGVAGVVLNSPSPVTAVRDVAMAVNIPVVATDRECFESARRISRMIVKTQPGDADKVSTIEALIRKNVDLDRILAAI